MDTEGDALSTINTAVAVVSYLAGPRWRPEVDSDREPRRSFWGKAFDKDSLAESGMLLRVVGVSVEPSPFNVGAEQVIVTVDYFGTAYTMRLAWTLTPRRRRALPALRAAEYIRVERFVSNGLPAFEWTEAVPVNDSAAKPR